ncbi:hypothetical protein PR048_012500 [Dryococelus australis]|uniref:Uncharacterized protein n=1 Tax=Dryococelus australis TaxID=614101 RepID=A0ABQ9HPK5_9NEOP|nr:hypothetical protein PR048_012500 [Dryococelus australis]
MDHQIASQYREELCVRVTVTILPVSIDRESFQTYRLLPASQCQDGIQIVRQPADSAVCANLSGTLPFPIAHPTISPSPPLALILQILWAYMHSSRRENHFFPPRMHLHRLQLTPRTGSPLLLLTGGFSRRPLYFSSFSFRRCSILTSLHPHWLSRPPKSLYSPLHSIISATVNETFTKEMLPCCNGRIPLAAVPNSCYCTSMRPGTPTAIHHCRLFVSPCRFSPLRAGMDIPKPVHVVCDYESDITHHKSRKTNCNYAGVFRWWRTVGLKEIHNFPEINATRLRCKKGIEFFDKGIIWSKFSCGSTAKQIPLTLAPHCPFICKTYAIHGWFKLTTVSFMLRILRDFKYTNCSHMTSSLDPADLKADQGEERRVQSGTGMQGRGKREIPEKTRRPVPSSDTVPTCENLGMTSPGFEPGSPSRTGFPHVGIAPDDATGRRVFPRISRFPWPLIPGLLHSHLTSPASALKTSMLRAAQICPLLLLTHTFSIADVTLWHNVLSSPTWSPPATTTARRETSPSLLPTLSRSLSLSLIFHTGDIEQTTLQKCTASPHEICHCRHAQGSELSCSVLVVSPVLAYWLCLDHFCSPRLDKLWAEYGLLVVPLQDQQCCRVHASCWPTVCRLGFRLKAINSPYVVCEMGSHLGSLGEDHVPTSPGTNMVAKMAERTKTADGRLRLQSLIPRGGREIVREMSCRGTGMTESEQLQVPITDSEILLLMTNTKWFCFAAAGGMSLECKGVPLEKPPASGNVQYDSHMRKSGSEPAGDRARIAVVGGEHPSHCTTAAPEP